MHKYAEVLKQGGVGVVPTDTIYGLVGSALDLEAVERIYAIKDRQSDKPLIILISSIDDIEQFDIQLDQPTKQKVSEFWPGPTSVILPCNSENFAYLHRGQQSLAFRLPDKPDLGKLIETAGPLVAPSANPEGQPPAATISEARNYFGDQVDFYHDQGKQTGKPSTLLRLEPNGSLTTLRS